MPKTQPERTSVTTASTSVVEQIIARALIDNVFRDLLFTNRAEALREYELSEADVKALDLLEQHSLDSTEEVAVIVGATCSAYIPNKSGDLHKDKFGD